MENQASNRPQNGCSPRFDSNASSSARNEPPDSVQERQSEYVHAVRRTIPPRECRPQRAAASNTRNKVRQIIEESKMPLQRYFVNEIWKARSAQSLRFKQDQIKEQLVREYSQGMKVTQEQSSEQQSNPSHIENTKYYIYIIDYVRI